MTNYSTCWEGKCQGTLRIVGTTRMSNQGPNVACQSGKGPLKCTWCVSWDSRLHVSASQGLRRRGHGERAQPPNDRSKQQRSETSGKKSEYRIRVRHAQPARETPADCWMTLGCDCLHGAGLGTVYKLGEWDIMARRTTILWVWLNSFFTGRDLSNVWISIKGRESPELSKISSQNFL